MRRLLLATVWLAACGQENKTVEASAEPPAVAAAGTTDAPAPASVAFAPGQAADGTVVASWEGGQIDAKALAARTDAELAHMETEYLLNRFELQSQALDGLIVDQLLTAEAKRLNHPDVDSLLKAELESKIQPPTEQQIADFYPMVARQLGGASLEDSKPLLIQELTRQAQQEAFSKYIADLKVKAGLKNLLPYPELPRVEVPIVATDAQRGSPDAKVTIVQFAEYQCYYCGVVAPTVDRVLKEYDGKVKFVFKDYPLPAHSRALPAAVAAHCAGEQGKYWEMNATLLANQQALEDEQLRGYAKKAGVKMDDFDKCVDSGKWEPLITASAAEGQKVGVSATPTFYINGTLVSGAQSFDRFKTVIDRELAAAN